MPDLLPRPSRRSRFAVLGAAVTLSLGHLLGAAPAEAAVPKSLRCGETRRWLLASSTVLRTDLTTRLYQVGTRRCVTAEGRTAKTLIRQWTSGDITSTTGATTLWKAFTVKDMRQVDLDVAGGTFRLWRFDVEG